MKKLDTIRVLTFDILTDDRFEENIEELIKTKVSKIEELLDIEGIKIKTDGIERHEYKEQGFTQYTCDFYIKKDTRAVTWEDIQKMVKSVNPELHIVFSFINVFSFDLL